MFALRRRGCRRLTGSSRVNTLNGAKISVDGTTLDDGTQIVAPDAADASNGIIHVISAVLTP